MLKGLFVAPVCKLFNVLRVKAVRHKFLGKGLRHILVIVFKDPWILREVVPVDSFRVLFEQMHRLRIERESIPVNLFGILF